MSTDARREQVRRLALASQHGKQKTGTPAEQSASGGNRACILLACVAIVYADKKLDPSQITSYQGSSALQVTSHKVLSPGQEPCTPRRLDT